MKNLTMTVLALIFGLAAGAGLTQLDELTEQPTPVVVLAAPAQTMDDAVVQQPASATYDSPFDSLDGTEAFTPAQLTELNYAADRVCEGLTANVPLMVLADTVSAEQGLTDEQAHDFVAEVALERC